MGRAHDHHVEPAGRDAQRLGLREVLGDRVGDVERGREHVTLVHGPAGPRRPDGADRGGVHDPLHARAQRLLEHDPRPLDVDAGQLGGRGAEVRGPGHVEDAVDAPQRPPQRRAIAQGRRGELDVEPGERLTRRARPDRRAHAVAPGDERPGDM